MRKTSAVGRFLLLGAVVFGCVRVVPPPPVREVGLGTLKAPNRDYAAAQISPCQVDPGPLLADLTAMNDLLASFLEQTAAGPDGAWSDEQLGVLEQAAKTLGPEVAIHQATLNALEQCGFGDKHKFTVGDVRRRGDELAKHAKQRAAEAPGLLVQIRRRRALDQWRQGELAAQEQERKSWCPPKPKLIPDVYYAWEDETGRIEWLFCDGSKVVAAPGAEAEHVPPAEDERRGSKSIQTPAGYVKSAKKFPDSEIRRPPAELQASPSAAATETGSE